MSELVRICSRSELPPVGEAREVEYQGRLLCMANDRGRLTLMDNVCPHRGGPLGQGLIENGKLICPWHAWAFDLKTGQATHSQDRVQVFEVEMRGEDVFGRL
jgi:nitrite reductase (NADH) small subunit